jgi:hypothetical protein
VPNKLGLEPAEAVFFRALNELQVRYLVVGLSAALLEGAPVVTQDIDIWFGDTIAEAAKRAGGFYVSGLMLDQPRIGGEGLERLDLVISPHGLRSFEEEYAVATHHELAGLRMSALPLERVVASKRAAGRVKDLAVIPALDDTLAANRARRAKAALDTFARPAGLPRDRDRER